MAKQMNDLKQIATASVDNLNHSQLLVLDLVNFRTYYWQYKPSTEKKRNHIYHGH